MTKKAKIIDLGPSLTEFDARQKMELKSGRIIKAATVKNEDLLEIVGVDGEVTVTMRLTENGPVFTAKGVCLELKAVEQIDLEAKKINIKASQEAKIESRGSLKIESSAKMDLHSDDEVKVVGKLIHLN